MGLDMWAFATVGAQADERNSSSEIAYWRKHPNLHGWMKQLWESKGNSGDFNGDDLELTWDDITDLENAIVHGALPDTNGFFFGNNSDDHYRDKDLEFITEARTQIFLGFKVIYSSSW